MVDSPLGNTAQPELDVSSAKISLARVPPLYAVRQRGSKQLVQIGEVRIACLSEGRAINVGENVLSI